MRSQLLEWGVSTRMLRGQNESGDRHLVRTLPHGVLLAMVDGIGHGREAALAAETAIQTLEAQPGDPLESMLGRCHEKLRGTRGVVMSLAAYHTDDLTLTWAGVGNVEGLLVRAEPGQERDREWLVPRRGVVGGRLPVLRTSTFGVKEGDLLILATDGVDPGFSQELERTERPQALADSILARHGKATDDATVLVARLAGG
jgi:phosphoserine phosphatase RsbX